MRNSVAQARAQAQASRADLVNATLSAQGELASDYVQRALDAQKAVLDDTVKVYAQALAVTKNRLKEGVAAEQDVFQADAQWRDACAQSADLDRQRATMNMPSLCWLARIPPTSPSPRRPGMQPCRRCPPCCPGSCSSAARMWLRPSARSQLPTPTSV
jgi:hypothetical protein